MNSFLTSETTLLLMIIILSIFLYSMLLKDSNSMKDTFTILTKYDSSTIMTNILRFANIASLTFGSYFLWRAVVSKIACRLSAFTRLTLRINIFLTILWRDCIIFASTRIFTMYGSGYLLIIKTAACFKVIDAIRASLI